MRQNLFSQVFYKVVILINGGGLELVPHRKLVNKKKNPHQLISKKRGVEKHSDNSEVNLFHSVSLRFFFLLIAMMAVQ